MQINSLEQQLQDTCQMRASTQRACREAEQTLAEFRERMSAEVEEQGRKFHTRERELLDQVALLNKQLNEKHASSTVSGCFVQEELASTQRQLQQAKVELAGMEEKCLAFAVEAQEATKQAGSLSEKISVRASSI
jgi:hypothetical protein